MPRYSVVDGKYEQKGRMGEASVKEWLLDLKRTIPMDKDAML